MLDHVGQYPPIVGPSTRVQQRDTTQGTDLSLQGEQLHVHNYPRRCPYTHSVTVKALVNAYEGLFGKAPVVDKWTFSTNGVSIMGRHGIPVIGFGPGKEPEAHAPNEKTWKSHLVTCAAMYAAIPLSWLATE